MAYNHKEVAARPARLTSGHRMCAGCGAPAVPSAYTPAAVRRRSPEYQIPVQPLCGYNIYSLRPILFPNTRNRSRAASICPPSVNQPFHLFSGLTKMFS